MNFSVSEENYIKSIYHLQQDNDTVNTNSLAAEMQTSPASVTDMLKKLQAKKLLPVHWGKFSLSVHAWDEPIIRVTNEAKMKLVQVVHPMIGEALDLEPLAHTSEWWKNLDNSQQG